MERSKAGKVISVMIIFILIVAVVVLFYQNTQTKWEVENKFNELEKEMNQMKEQENQLKNEIENHEIESSLVPTEKEETTEKIEGDRAEYYISTGKWKEFKFSTPVGETGTFEVYAEKAVQATGFSGASAHIYYLREGNLYYHNEGDIDTQIASGIVDLKIQGEDVIAVKGENAKIMLENSYIQYQ